MSRLVRPKVKTQKEKQCGVVYSVKCGGCEKEYIGETATLGVTFREHTGGKHPNSAITKHTATTGHKYTLDNVKVLIREENGFKRKVKEAISIHKSQPSVNRDRGHKIPPDPPPTCVT